MRRAGEWLRDELFSPGKIVLVAGTVAALVWWQWPLLSNSDSRTDVVLLADNFLTSTERPVTSRIHEDGRSLRWSA
ncbi:MAG TPA: hypothetical protein VLD86_11135, partial [Ilumatobacteraceae bacterium]|nr:hypothetical protein [Ilumatobacteraceae bacterium]